MGSLNSSNLLNQMIGAAKVVINDKWPEVRDLGTSSFKSLAEGLVDIERMKSENKVTDEQAKLLIDMHKNTLRIVLLSVEGLGILAVEGAINAALNVIRDVVNTATGINLL